MPFSRFIVAVLAIPAAFLFSSTAAQTSAYPSKPITIVSPYPPGGTTDILARLLAVKLTAALHQPVIVENKAGASSNIGTEFVARAKSDGYTLLLGNNTGMVINQNLYKLAIKPSQDLAPVILVAQVPTVLYVHPSVAARTLDEFIGLVKQSPQDYAFASAGSGSPQHLAGELLKLEKGLKMTHVPYKGSAPALSDVLAGHVKVGFESTMPLMPHIASGRLRPLATTGPARSIALPEVPTMIESDLAGFNLTNWYGLFAPTGTSKAVIDRLNSEVQEIMADKETQDKLAKLGSSVQPASAEEFAKLIQSEVPKSADLVKKSGAKVD